MTILIFILNIFISIINFAIALLKLIFLTIPSAVIRIVRKFFRPNNKLKRLSFLKKKRD